MHKISLLTLKNLILSSTYEIFKLFNKIPRLRGTTESNGLDLVTLTHNLCGLHIGALGRAAAEKLTYAWTGQTRENKNYLHKNVIGVYYGKLH